MSTKISRYTAYVSLMLALPALTGCIEETFPSSSATSEQVTNSSTALESIVNSLTSYTMSYNVYGASDYTDAGIPSCMLARDRMCEDYPVSSPDWDWYYSVATGSSSYWGGYPYYYFYTFIDKANDMLKVIDPDNVSSDTRHMVGNLYGFRAMCYMDLTRMFEFQPTGYPQLDNQAMADNIIGLTVPIVEARDYTVSEYVANPRAPFYTMYRFIMTDLDLAEELLEGFTRSKVSYLDQSVIYGFKARLWLEMATRFQRSQEDLALQLGAEGSGDGYHDLGITSALDCYRNALSYADKVINSGYTPMSESEWHDPVNGFNTPNNSWVWGSYITTAEERPSRWYAFHGLMASDTSWGWATDEYGMWQCISSSLYSTIPDADWRKRSWIDPADAGKKNVYTKYSSNQTEANFRTIPAYANLKFHVPDLVNYDSGLLCSVPFMRVEEMYLLRAEALYYTDGLGAAVSALESFVNTYRYTDGSYTCTASNFNNFIDKLMNQRRIELWGEGLVYFDYKRLRLGVNRAYTGTNYPETYRMVTSSGCVAPWMNCYITEYAVSMKDAAFKGNPEFSNVVKAVN